MKQLRRVWNNFTLMTKALVLLLLAGLIPLLIASIIMYSVAVRAIDDAASEFAEIFNSQAVSALESFVTAYDSLTKSTLINENLTEYLDFDTPVTERMQHRATLRQRFISMITLQPDVKSVSVISKFGGYYGYEGDGTSIDPTVLQRQQWLKDALEEEGPLIITPLHDRSYYDRFRDKTVITVIRKIYNLGGYQGYLMLDVDPASIMHMGMELLEAQKEYNIRIRIEDRHGVRIYDSFMPGDILTDREKDEFSGIPDNPQHYYLSVSDAGQQNLKIYVVIPRDRLLERVNSVRQTFLILAVLSILLEIGVGFAITHSIIQPVRQVQASMARLEKGDYQLIELDERGDELGELVESCNHMVNRIHQLIDEVYLAQIAQKDAQYLALQTQINPHMLYNTLESIRMKALMADDDDTAEMIKLLAKMLRAALNGDESTHTVRDEIEYANAYVRLQQLRYRGRCMLSVDIEEELLQLPVISMVFQPIIENSISHGFRDAKSELHIHISASVTGADQVHFRIFDDGKGMDEQTYLALQRRLAQIRESGAGRMEDVDGKRSIGLDNIARRLAIHYGRKGYAAVSRSDAMGTCVDVVIPYDGRPGSGDGTPVEET